MALYLYDLGGNKAPVVLDNQAKGYLDAQLIGGKRKVLFNASFGEGTAAIYTVNTDGTGRKLLLDDAVTSKGVALEFLDEN